MDINGVAALSAFTYRSSLTSSGNATQALHQALAANQAQVSEVGALFSGSASATQDPLYAMSVGPQNLAFLNRQGSTSTALFSTSDNLPSSAALLAPSSAAALARYAYDQTQDPQTSTQLAQAAALQARQTSGMDLLA